MKIRVYYEDTDAGGIVYHTNYIKYCERARSEVFFRQGKLPGEGAKSGFVVKHIDADFLGSAKLGDLLEVKSTLVHMKRSSMTLLQEIYREDTRLFAMHIQLVYMENAKISPISKAVKALLQYLND